MTSFRWNIHWQPSLSLETYFICTKWMLIYIWKYVYNLLVIISHLLKTDIRNILWVNLNPIVKLVSLDCEWHCQGHIKSYNWITHWNKIISWFIVLKVCMFISFNQSFPICSYDCNVSIESNFAQYRRQWVSNNLILSVVKYLSKPWFLVSLPSSVGFMCCVKDL